MSSSPVKTFAFIGLAAIIGAGMLSKNLDPTPQQPTARPTGEAAAPAQQQGWFSSLFSGIEFNRGPAAPPAARTQTVAVAQPQPAPAKASGFGAVILKADPAGHFHAQIEIDGQRIPMMVDTGATIVALRAEDARRLGLNPMPSDFTVPISTANGEIRAARMNLREVRLENLIVTDVAAVVMPQGVLSQSLLGMSFMKKLGSFQVANGELALRP